MNTKRIGALGITLISVLALFLWGVHASPARAQTGDDGNLLVDGDFETHTQGQTWPWQDGIGEVQVAPGWRAFYIDEPPSYAAIASYCQDGHGGRKPGCIDWGRPEFRDTSIDPNPFRVHSGLYAQKYFSWNRQHQAGLYQQVTGVTPGKLLRFTIYVQVWSCLPVSSEEWNVCPTQPYSNNPANSHVWAGIDPTGGTNPFAPSVVRSPEGNPVDAYVPFTVEAVAQSSTVTVFVHSWADWSQDTWPRVSNDVYIDDGSLIYVGEAPPPTALPTNTPPTDLAEAAASPTPAPPTDTPAPAPPTTEPSPTSAPPTDAPSPVPPTSEASPISEASPTSAPPTNAPPPASPTSEAGATSGTGSICALVFNDRDGDTFRQVESEELVPNAALSLGDATSSLVSQYVTDGLNEPYCFTDLAAGSYRVVVQPPPGYIVSGLDQIAVTLDAGEQVDVALGVQRGKSGDSPVTKTLSWGLIISGVVILALAAALVVVITRSRQR